MFWTNFGKIEKIHFFHLPPVGLGQNNVEIDIPRPNIGHIILRPGPNTLGLFPKKMYGFVDLSFVRNLFFVIFRQKSMILQNWAF